MTHRSKIAYYVPMTKTQAIKMFGSVTGLAKALGIHRQAIYQWPEQLKQRTSDEVTGAAIRLEIEVPDTLAA